MASLVFTLAAPADLAPRYLITALPCAAVVAATGLLWPGALLFRRPGAAGAFAAALLLADAAAVFRPPHVSDLGLTVLASRVLADPAGGATVLVAGSPRAEGGLIAAFGALDPGHTHYVLRGTQQLGGGDFMGTRYQARFGDPAALRDWLEGSGVSWLLLDRTTEGLALSHDGQVAAAMDPPPPGWSVAGQHRAASGPVTLFRRHGPEPSPDQLRALLNRAVPNG